MKPLRRKCIYKRSDNFQAILDQFFNDGKQLVPDDIMKAIRNEIHNRDNILYNYEIPLMIPILECILTLSHLADLIHSQPGRVDSTPPHNFAFLDPN